MAKVCLLLVWLGGCAPVVAHALPEPSLATAPASEREVGTPVLRARVARLSPPFAARVAARRVSETLTDAEPLTEVASH